MSIVIVTKNQYLIASKIHFITLNEGHEYVEVGHGYQRNTYKELIYNIHIVYSSDTTSTNNNNSNHINRDEHRECNVSIRGKVNAHKVYRDLIRQIREQTPDQLFLDKALEALLGEDISVIENQEREDLKCVEAMNDRSTKSVRKPRKTKRASKKVLRRPKGGNRGRKG